MKIRGEKLRYVVHQEPITQIAVKMDIKAIAVRIEQRRDERQGKDQAEMSQAFSRVPTAFRRCGSVTRPEVRGDHQREQGHSYQKSSVEVNPRRHQRRQKEKMPALTALI